MVKIIIYSFIAGVVGTTLGGLISLPIKNRSTTWINVVLGAASGFMLAITCFELIPSALEHSGILTLFLGLTIGIAVIGLLDFVTSRYNKSKRDSSNRSSCNSGSCNCGCSASGKGNIGWIVLLAIAFHNFPEGMAIGSGEIYGNALAMTVLMSLHNIPEGMAIALPLMSSGVKKRKVFSYVILSGLPTVLGAIFGATIGNISESVNAICLSIAAGAMLYVVVFELYQECYGDKNNGVKVSISNMLGILIGLLVILLL